ncbi:peptidyl-prolyl cis-trans isomerase [Elioraea tepidiphila]|jgi:peptidyl-prolyl cis-trans isomerase D|uniref:peptidylprolyl isomerase n=1 Tax=Elioraea tepidiphila TaxID=457934 RepID=UPI002FDB1761
MLTAIRNSLNHWIAKGLFLLLIVAFAVWGIEDFVRGGGADRSVATVAGEKVSLAEATDAYQREISQLRRSFGGQFEPTEEVRRAIAEATVARLVALRAISAEAAQRGVVVTDDALRATILSAPGFQGPDGRFSRLQFDSFLRNNGLTEGRFLDLLRSDLARQQLVGSVRAGAAAPQTLARAVQAFHAEQRVADLVELPLMAAPAPPEPTEAQLARFHENNADLFSAPEFRQFDLVLLSPEDVAREIRLSDRELREAFEERRAEFATPERRRIAQAVVPDREAARAIAEAWRAGADFAAIAAQAQAAGGSAIELGLIDRSGLPLPELADPAFAASAGAVTDPVQSPFGWHVLHVAAIEPGREQGFEAVKDELARIVALERAADLIYARANRIEDSIAEGIPLTEVARRHELRLIQATMDAEGRDPDGNRIELGPEAGEIISAVFESRIGETTRLSETRGGVFYAVHVGSVTPPALRPLAEVEREVRAAWERAERRRAMEEQAAALIAETRAGRPLDEVARAAGWSPRRTEPFTRDVRGGAFPPQLAAALFALKRGEATMIETGSGFVVAAVAEIIPGAAEGPAIAARQQELAEALAGDLEAQFVQALRDRADVRIVPGATRLIAGDSP